MDVDVSIHRVQTKVSMYRRDMAAAQLLLILRERERDFGHCIRIYHTPYIYRMDILYVSSVLLHRNIAYAPKIMHIRQY